MNEHLPTDPDTFHLVRMAQFGIMAGMGGAAKFVSVVVKSKEKMTTRRFLLSMSANIFVSGFTGVVAMLIVSTMTDDVAIQGAAAGVFGWSGAITLDIIALTMQKRFLGTAGPISNAIPIPPSLDSSAQ